MIPFPLVSQKVPKTAYIAGPMTNRPGFNFPAFDAVAERCRTVDGWSVWNPHEHDQEMYPGIDDAEATQVGDVQKIAEEVGFDLHLAMTWDLQAVSIAEHLVLLPEWETSSGAKAERFVGEMTGSKIWLASKCHPSAIDFDDVKGWYLTLDPKQKRLAPAQLAEVSA